jgi:hypothetical protein
MNTNNQTSDTAISLDDYIKLGAKKIADMVNKYPDATDADLADIRAHLDGLKDFTNKK